MSGASFVTCPGCGRLMLGQRIGGATHPQPHVCEETATPAERWRVVDLTDPSDPPRDFDTKAEALVLVDELIDLGHKPTTFPITIDPAGEVPC